MSRHFENITILFADIVGSVALYEAVGDVAARKLIVRYFNWMQDIINAHGGHVVEFIGDEVMCLFNDPNAAINVACSIQEHLDRRGATQKIRIGINRGQTALENGRPFGDTVNVASRVVNLAKAGEIIATKQTIEALSTSNREKCRSLGALKIKGKVDPVQNYEVLWNLDDCTFLRNAQNTAERRLTLSRVVFRYQEHQTVLDAVKRKLVIGRDEKADIQVKTRTASRFHATITFQSGAVVLADQSTNGTFIKAISGRRSDDGREFYLHREERFLSGKGMLSLGESEVSTGLHVVFFSCEEVVRE
ncbi:MAG: adenylate/guanylate cyclase domain-containing protein [Methylococcales bacterium]